jgi:hypothetical protein
MARMRASTDIDSSELCSDRLLLSRATAALIETLLLDRGVRALRARRRRLAPLASVRSEGGVVQHRRDTRSIRPVEHRGQPQEAAARRARLGGHHANAVSELRGGVVKARRPRGTRGRSEAQRLDGAEHSSHAQTRDGSRGNPVCDRRRITCASLTRNASRNRHVRSLNPVQNRWLNRVWIPLHTLR